MLEFAVVVLAQRTQNMEGTSDGGVGAALIVGTLVAIVLVLALVFLVVSKRTKASRGGVEPVPGSRRRKGPPPFESIERDR